jgi:hypothetical protein
MEKRNTLLLTVIAVATLLVAVVGATFAYFATSTTGASGNIGITANTAAGGNSTFTAVGDTISLNITAADMQQSAVAEGTAKATDNATLTVSYTSGSTNSTSCTYNVYYKWESGSSAYTPVTSGTSNKEFTYAVSGDMTVSETNFVATDTTEHQLGTQQTITNASASVPTTKTYTVDAKFYNLNADQSTNSNASFKLSVYVGNIVC